MDTKTIISIVLAVFILGGLIYQAQVILWGG